MEDWDKFRAVCAGRSEPARQWPLKLAKVILLVASALLLLRAGAIVHQSMPSLLKYQR